jgi:hypothetical protein
MSNLINPNPSYNDDIPYVNFISPNLGQKTEEESQGDFTTLAFKYTLNKA